MVLLDTAFMNYGLLSTGSTLFWFAIVIALIIWRNTKNILTVLGIMAILIPIFLIDAVRVNAEVAIIGLVLIVILLIERYLID